MPTTGAGHASKGTPGGAAARAEAPGAGQSEAGEGEVIEVVVEEPRSDWLFPKLDHPRVQAFFRSSSSTGSSLFDAGPPPPPVPLVRTGSVRVHGAAGGAERRAARRFARHLIADRREALEACYVDALGRSAGDAVQLTLSVQVQSGSRGAFHLSRGVLGDVYGNACVLGVLEFAPGTIGARDRAEALRASTVEVDIPVWFWLQTQRAPS